ncbi:MAG: transcriptional regulator [Verrucomicrobiota bacterium]
MNETAADLANLREDFIAQWGAMGGQWGINATMARIHAYLMTSTGPAATDEVMEALEISRGNAHTNLKELVAWGLVRIVLRKGERREFFDAEKDVWKIFTIIARERKRREIDPALGVLRRCAEGSAQIDSPDGRAFHQQMKQLEEFVAFASSMSDRIAAMNYGAAKIAAKLLR